MANIPKPENDDSLELNVRYQPDMVLEGMLDATVPEFTQLTLTMGDDVYDLTGGGLPDYSEANDGDVLQIASGEPTWGAVDALPEIEETDEGKVLAVDQGEAVWADAPSGLPEITNSDEGKVLTVVQGTETVTFVPEQSVTLESAGGGTYAGLLANVSVTPSDFTEGEVATITIGENSYDVTYSATAVASIPGFSDDVNGFGLLYDNSTWTLVMAESGTVTVSATREEAGDLEAEWAEPSGGGSVLTAPAITLTNPEQDVYVVTGAEVDAVMAAAAPTIRFVKTETDETFFAHIISITDFNCIYSAFVPDAYDDQPVIVPFGVLTIYPGEGGEVSVTGFEYANPISMLYDSETGNYISDLST